MFITVFVIKLIDQLLRTGYIVLVGKNSIIATTIIAGVQQAIRIYTIYVIASDTSMSNILALVSATMLGSYITMTMTSRNAVK